MNVKLTLPKGSAGGFDNFLKKGALWYIANESEHNVCLRAAQSTSISPQSITSFGISMSAENKMRRKYLKPPVIEAVCEFRLAPDTQWDTTIPGLIYEKVKKEGFKIKAQGMIPQPTMVASPQGIVQTMRLQQSVRFLTEDNTKFVQVAPGILSINCLRPYPSWEKGFKPLIEKMFDIFSNAAQVDFFQRIGLMYNNRIEIPSPSGHIRLDDYFEFKPFLGPDMPQNMKGFIVGSLFPFAEDERDLCRVELKTAKPEHQDHAACSLMLDYFLAKPQTVSATEVQTWIEKAHENLETTFEGCITKGLRALFVDVQKVAE